MILKLLTLFLVVGLVSADSYDKINRYLENNVGKNEPLQNNMAKASSWLSSKSSTFCLGSFFGKRARNLRQFVSIETAVEPKTKCTIASIGILSEVDAAIGNKAHKPQSLFLKDVTRRVEQVVHHYHLDHANMCVFVYPDRFKRMFPTSPESWSEITTRIDDLASRAWYYQTDGLVYNLASRKLRYKTVDSSVTAKAIFNLLKSYSVEDDPDLVVIHKNIPPTGNSELVRALIEHILKRYLMDPCLEFVRSTSEIFAPADYDRIMGIEYMGENDEDDKRYHSNVARYRICNLLREVTAKRFSQLILPFLKISQRSIDRVAYTRGHVY